jgi:DnaK suppressor protein
MARQEVITELRKRLSAERESLQEQIQSLSAENQVQHDDAGVGNHLADDATDIFTRERNIALSNNAQELLAQVDSALQRLDQGSYGVCARCGREISTERLEALPYATLCISCQSEVERERG